MLKYEKLRKKWRIYNQARDEYYKACEVGLDVKLKIKVVKVS